MKKFKVGVFPQPISAKGRKRRYMAYTKWYSPEWDGCIVMWVEAENATQAKKLAIQKVRDKTSSTGSNNGRG